VATAVAVGVAVAVAVSVAVAVATQSESCPDPLASANKLLPPPLLLLLLLLLLSFAVFLVCVSRWLTAGAHSQETAGAGYPGQLAWRC
jgi:hypothetical protein